MIIIIIITICITPFARGYKVMLLIIMVSGKSSIILLHLMVLLAKCTPSQHIDCNISYNQHLPYALWSQTRWK